MRLFPRKILALVLGPFLLGSALLLLLVELTPVVRTLLYLVLIGGLFAFVFLGVGFVLLLHQSRGLDSVDGSGE